MSKVQFTRGGNACGTFLLDNVRVSYHHLVNLFGKPDEGDGYKTDAEWVLTFPGDIVATIYNWKDGTAYCGPAGTPVEQITDWHVGGKVREALWFVQQVIGGR
jgi:hypothetical protein